MEFAALKHGEKSATHVRHVQLLARSRLLFSPIAKLVLSFV